MSHRLARGACAGDGRPPRGSGCLCADLSVRRDTASGGRLLMVPNLGLSEVCRLKSKRRVSDRFRGDHRPVSECPLRPQTARKRSLPRDALTSCVATPRSRNALACSPRKPIVALRRCRSSRHGGRNSIGDTGRTGNPLSGESLSQSDRDKGAAVQGHGSSGSGRCHSKKIRPARCTGI